MFVSRSRIVFLLVVAVSSTRALPIETGPGNYDRRNDLGLSYGQLKKSIDEVLRTPRRTNPFEEYDDDDDMQRYLDENLDYGLLETLTYEMLEENGGDLDRPLSFDEYGEISERYFKRLEEGPSTKNANAWKTSSKTEHGTKKFGTSMITPTRDNKTPTDDGKTTSRQGINTTPHQDVVSTTATQRDEWRTSPSYWDGTVFDWKTTWQNWKPTTAHGTDSWQTHKHTKHFDWTGESKSGHRVHVVVYFEK